MTASPPSPLLFSTAETEGPSDATVNDTGSSQTQDAPKALEKSLPTSRSSLRSIGIVAACTSSMMMNNANAFPAIALPSIGQDLQVVQTDLQWVLNAYAISSACFLLLSGRLADLYGRKRMWLAGYLFISVFGLGCGFAQNGTTLFVLRGFQGLGGATVIPASLGILAHSFPPSPARSAAFATFAAGAPLGGVVTFFIGAVLVQLTGPAWRTLFYVMAGMSASGLVLGLVCIEQDEPSTEEDRRVDWLGALLITAGLVLIVYVLSASPIAPRGWKTDYIIALFVVGGCLVIAFIVWQVYLEHVQDKVGVPRTRWTPPPLMKLSMWKRARGRFAAMQIIAGVNWAAFSCWIVWVQLYYQNFLKLTPILSMVRIIPIAVVGIFANIAITLLIGRVNVQYIVTFGTLVTGIALLLFAIIDPTKPYWAYGFPSALLIVLGADFVFAPGTLFIAKVSLPHEQSTAGATFQAMTLIGTAIGLSISTIVFNGVLSSKSRAEGVVLDALADNAPRDAQLKAYHAAMWTAFGFSMLCVLLSLFLRGVGIVGHPPQPKIRSLPDTELQDEKQVVPAGATIPVLEGIQDDPTAQSTAA